MKERVLGSECNFQKETTSRLRKKSFSSGGRCFSADVNCVLSMGFSP
jgi:hypothetical protein